MFVTWKDMQSSFFSKYCGGLNSEIGKGIKWTVSATKHSSFQHQLCLFAFIYAWIDCPILFLYHSVASMLLQHSVPSIHLHLQHQHILLKNLAEKAVLVELCTWLHEECTLLCFADVCVHCTILLEGHIRNDIDSPACGHIKIVSALYFISWLVSGGRKVWMHWRNWEL